jgi:Fic family protein
MLNTASIIITPEILRIVAEIDEFKGAWQALGKLPHERLDNLRKIAVIESVGASSRIAGAARLDNADVSTLLSQKGNRSLRTRGEQDAAGYAEVFETIYAEVDLIELTENHIRQLHRDLLYYSKRDDRHRGVYKTRSAGVDVFGESELSLGRHAGIVPVGAIPRYMAELVDWARSELNHGLLHPILVTAIFTAGLLGIQPFESGTGRLSRLLISVCLRIAGYN